MLTPQLEELVGSGPGLPAGRLPDQPGRPGRHRQDHLALHLAARLRQPVTLIHGDDEFGSSDLVGNDHGYRKSKLVDNFIHSVVRTEETMKTMWMDNRLTTACRYGHVLIYDEFTRSRPEANNVLLSVLGERLLNLPKLAAASDGYLEVHPQFRAIFTSNPQEYAGVHKSQDALLDRLITIYMDHYDRRDRSGDHRRQRRRLPGTAERIVDLVRSSANRTRPASIRASGRRSCSPGCWRPAGRRAIRADPVFQSACRDVLRLDHAFGRGSGAAFSGDQFDAAVASVWGDGVKAGSGATASQKPCCETAADTASAKPWHTGVRSEEVFA